MAILHKICVGDIMVKNVITIGLDDPFSKAWDIFRTHKIRHLPVVNRDQKIKGLITQRDLYKTLAPKKEIEDEGTFYLKEDLDKFILQKVMIKDVATLFADDTLGKAVDIMVKKKYGCLPVVDKQGVLVGILTQTDALRALAPFVL